MIRSLRFGAVAGMRALTPFAAVSDAARRNRLPLRTRAPAFPAHPSVGKAGLLLVAGQPRERSACQVRAAASRAPASRPAPVHALARLRVGTASRTTPRALPC